MPSSDSPADATPAAPVPFTPFDEAGPDAVPLDPTPESAGESSPAVAQPGASGDSSAAPSPADAGASCEALGGFSIEETESCYLLSDDAFDWQEARSFCQEWGGDLVEIGSPEENVALAGRVPANVWIGANDREQEGAFRWSSGAPLDFTQWAPNQPNNLDGNEDCSELVSFGAVWIDVPCSGEMPRRALCEGR